MRTPRSERLCNTSARVQKVCGSFSIFFTYFCKDRVGKNIVSSLGKRSSGFRLAVVFL